MWFQHFGKSTTIETWKDQLLLAAVGGKWSTGDFPGSETILYDIVILSTWYYASFKMPQNCTKHGVNPDYIENSVNNNVILSVHECNKCSISMQDFSKYRNNQWMMVRRNTCEFSVLSVQFLYKPKIP